MSDKKEVGLNEVDKQAVIAAWIIANDGCGSSNDVHCCGDMGIFKGTACLFYGHTGCIAYVKVGEAKAWLEKYHQQKAEAAEAEKRKVEAAKKEELEAKQEPARICGNCKHIHEVEQSENMTAQCDMKNSMVPILFDRCPDFEPRTEATFISSIAFSTCCNLNRTDKERIFQLEKEKAELLEGSERLMEQRNRLSNSLIGQRSSLAKAMRRVKEVELENAALYERISAMLSKLLYFQWKAETGQLMPFSVLNDIEERFKRIRQSWVSRLK